MSRREQKGSSRVKQALFQGRFKSFLIEKESYLREVIRYVVLNPVRAKMVQRPEDYRWSSYRATAGFEKAPPWLAPESIAGYFGETDTWQANYRDFVAEKIDSTECLWDQLMNQIYLGGERWAASIRARVESKPRSDAYPAVQRSVGRPKMHRIVHAVAGECIVTSFRNPVTQRCADLRSSF